MGCRFSSLVGWLVVVLSLGTVAGPSWAEPALSVLLIGNSYTLGHDLARVVREAAAAGGKPAPAVRAFAVGGRRLADHLADPDLERVLAQPWDVVVVQAYSLVPAMAEVDLAVRAEFVANCRSLATRVRAHNPAARIVFFETWARHPGLWPDGVDPRAGASPVQMQDRLRCWYAAVARECAGVVAPVGEAWRANYRSAEPLMLHEADGSHPAEAGTVLAALVLAKTIYGPALPSAFRGGLEPAAARRLGALAETAFTHRAEWAALRR